MSVSLAQFNAKLARTFAIRGITADGLDVPPGALLADVLVKAGRATPELVNAVLEEVTGLQSVDPTMVAFTPEFLAHARALIPGYVALRERVFPIRHERDVLHLAMALPESTEALRRLEQLANSRIRPYGCFSGRIVEALAAYYGPDPGQLDPADADAEQLTARAIQAVNRLKMARAGLPELVNDVRVIKLLRYVLDTLAGGGASDLHFEPQEDGFRVRFRKDGVMATAWTFPMLLKEPLSGRLKLVSGLDPEPSRAPQDGSIDIRVVSDRNVDVRVSTLPSLYGEKIVLRILDKSGKRRTLADLGLEPEPAGLLLEALQRPNGLLLATGPTGSGKSTTLYAALGELNSDDVNIVTAEDPVEYKLPGVTQVDCSVDSGVDFSSAIRAFLRQDPDVIMLGEIRDAVTADFAVKAAMTGHLVLSTLHTNDAAGAISRLINMGVPAFQVASAGITVVAQRLLRRICTSCRTPVDIDPALRQRLGDEAAPMEFFRGAGCERCNGTGYAGRVGIYEIMRVSERMEPLIMEHAPAGTLRRVAVEEGMVTLRQAALVKVAHGVTTLEELLRITLDT